MEEDDQQRRDNAYSQIDGDGLHRQRVDEVAVHGHHHGLEQQFLPQNTFNPDDDFLAIGGDTNLAAAIAAALSREFDTAVSRYDLVFSSRMKDWPEIVAASMRTEPTCTTT